MEEVEFDLEGLDNGEPIEDLDMDLQILGQMVQREVQALEQERNQCNIEMIASIKEKERKILFKGVFGAFDAGSSGCYVTFSLPIHGVVVLLTPERGAIH